MLPGQNTSSLQRNEMMIEQPETGGFEFIFLTNYGIWLLTNLRLSHSLCEFRKSFAATAKLSVIGVMAKHFRDWLPFI